MPAPSKPSFQTSRRRALIPAALLTLLSACTWGRVTHDGAPLEDAEVRIWTCDSIGDYQYQTDSSGIYAFNPFSPDSPAFDPDEFVPPGPIAVITTSASGSSVERREHQYTETCRVRFNGVIQDQACKAQHVDLEPMNLVEANAEVLAFLEDDCGLEASIISPPEDPNATDVSAVQSFLVETERHASCLSNCSVSCSGQAPADFYPCMCICVESSCGQSYGPACVENGIPPRP